MKFRALVLTVAFSLAAAIPCISQTSYTAQSGVSFFTAANATATATSAAVRLPNFSGAGVLTVTETGITGSPSGCTLALAYQSNNATTAGSAVSTTSFTPSTGVQQFAISPSVAAGDQYVLTYACASAYPTAGTLTVSFSPVNTVSSDPCNTAIKSSVAISITSATTTQLIALSAGQHIYVCGVALSSVGGTSTFEYGTGSSCGTGTTSLTGPFPASSTVILSGAETKFTAPVGNALCLVSGTSTSATGGVLTYVQQ